MQELERTGENFFQNLSILTHDPPDVIAETFVGKLIGVEVTELVDEKAVRQHQKGNEYFKFWSGKEIVEKIQNIINSKDIKVFYGGPYEKIILLIHTDEPFLPYEEFEKHISTHCFNKTDKIDDVYLFFSYSPKLACCPYIKLKIR